MKIVSAPLAGAVYPKGSQKNALIHAIEVNRAGIVRVLCGKVNVESILDDEHEWDRHAITCAVCARKWKTQLSERKS